MTRQRHHSSSDDDEGEAFIDDLHNQDAEDTQSYSYSEDEEEEEETSSSNNFDPIQNQPAWGDQSGVSALSAADSSFNESGNSLDHNDNDKPEGESVDLFGTSTSSKEKKSKKKKKSKHRSSSRSRGGSKSSSKKKHKKKEKREKPPHREEEEDDQLGALPVVAAVAVAEPDEIAPRAPPKHSAAALYGGGVPSDDDFVMGRSNNNLITMSERPETFNDEEAAKTTMTLNQYNSQDLEDEELEQEKRRETQVKWAQARGRIICYLIAITCGLIVLAALLGVLFALVFRKDDDDDSSPAAVTPANASAPTMAPVGAIPTAAVPTVAPVSTPATTTNAPTVAPIVGTVAPTTATAFITDQALYNLIVANSPPGSDVALQTVGSPQRRAYLWLQNDDAFRRRRRRGRRRLNDADFRRIQRYSLAAFFYAAHGDTDWVATTNWLGTTVSECTWHGITCDAQSSSVVTRVEFINNQVTGSVAPELGNLDQLVSLVLDNRGTPNHGLTGPLPTDVHLRWPGMTQLVLTGNDFSQSGTPLPDNFFQAWTQATLVDVSDNRFPAGPIPSSVGALAQVTTLNLSHNQFTGAMPAALGNLNQLQTLDLSHNQLSQAIPNAAVSVKSLVRIVLNNNQLSGSVPNFSGLLQTFGGGDARLEQLDLSNNALTGNFPSSLFNNLGRLTVLRLAENAGLSGALPSMARLGALREFDFSGLPNVVGTVPDTPVCNFVSANGGTGSIDNCSSAACNPAQQVCCSCCCDTGGGSGGNTGGGLPPIFNN